MAVEITEDLIERLVTNGREAYTVGSAIASEMMNIPAGMVAADEAKLLWFYGKCRVRGPWDFKSTIYRSYKAMGVKVAGGSYGYSMPGNLHFGYTGAALGLPTNVLHGGSAWADRQATSTAPVFWCIAGDEPADFDFIRLGVELFRQVSMTVTSSNLEALLMKYGRRNEAAGGARAG